MSADEIRTRGRQEIQKRLDLLAFRSGSGDAHRRFSTRSAQPGSFFFSANELTGRVDLLRTHLPAAVEQILAEADAACQHKFDLLGYKKLDYGPAIDWRLDAVHGKKAPLQPWFKVPFLDFNVVGDHKITWELNRHQYFVTLGKAWCITRDQRYANELRAQWYDWQKKNPYPIGINWGSSLEVAFRSISWLWALRLLAGSAALTREFEKDIRLALGFNATYIERYLSTYFSPNTHLLGEAVALFFIGTLVPELTSAERWRRSGWDILVREAQRQVRSDGVYFEQALYYHVYALDFFLHARIFANLNGVVIPEHFDRVLQSMLDVLYTLSQSGAPQSFGDDDGGRLFDPRRNRGENLSDPLAVGAMIFGRSDFASVPGLTEEAVWLFGQPTLAMLQASSHPSTPGSRAFPAGGLYVMTDTEATRQLMTVDAGPQGTGRSGHGHADALSLCYSFGGRPWLVDPGTYCYISDNRERDSWKGTGAHNTLRVDGVDQAEPAGPFAWDALPRVNAERWIAGNAFDLFVGSHDGYSRLSDPVTHRRLVFRMGRDFWFIRDVAEGKRRHTLESFWHFAPGLKIHEESGSVVAVPAMDSSSSHSDTRVALLPAGSSPWVCNLSAGVVSATYGAKEPAPVACFSASLNLPADFAVILVPMLRDTEFGTFSLLEEGNHDVRGYHYQVRSVSHFIFCAGSTGSWTLGSWASDAQFLYCCLEDRRLVQIILVAGSFAKWQGRPIVTHQREVERFEWWNKIGTTQSSSSDQSALAYILQGDLESADSVR